LTGALGAALLAKEEKTTLSAFRGIGLYKEELHVSTQTCLLCNNNCQISLASVQGEKVAYGFLCGREYDAGKPKSNHIKDFNFFSSSFISFSTSACIFVKMLR